MQTMRYQLLGRSGLRVSELCLGTMTFGTEWGNGADEAESRSMFDAYLERGGNFIDTANRYTEGTSERLLGQFWANNPSLRDALVVATKYSLYTEKGDVNNGGNHRKNLMRSVEGSLKRLQTDYIDLLWLHAWDFTTPVEEVMRGLDDLVRQGKVHYIGVSDTPAWVVSRAQMLAELRGWAPFVGLQIEYSLVQRTVERELVPMADELGLGILAWSPLGAGALTGKYLSQTATTDPQRLSADNWKLSPENRRIAQLVVDIATELGHTPSQVALNWLRQQRPAQVIPIVGARNLAQLTDNLDCLSWKLAPRHLQALSEISTVDLGFPMKFLSQPYVRTLLFGGREAEMDLR